MTKRIKFFNSKVAQMRAMFAVQRDGGIFKQSEIAKELKVSFCFIPVLAKLVGGLYRTTWEGEPAYTNDLRSV